MAKKLLCAWQQNVKRWIVKMRKTLRRQTWRERVIASGKKDPLVCPKCECYYEYKGEVCLEDGKLEIKVALGATTRAYLERVIYDLTSIQTSKKENQKEKSKLIKKEVSNDRQISLFAM